MQLVWIIPIVAALIGGWLAFKAITERGPTITITFKTAEGLEAGKTKIKYKDVEIGLVKTITLAEDRRDVVVTAELTKQAENFLVEDTRFWVVRARIAGGQVSGLGTLLSGSYIGVDLGKSKEERRTFTGLEAPPIVTGDLPGRQFLLGRRSRLARRRGAGVLSPGAGRRGRRRRARQGRQGRVVHGSSSTRPTTST